MCVLLFFFFALLHCRTRNCGARRAILHTSERQAAGDATLQGNATPPISCRKVVRRCAAKRLVVWTCRKTAAEPSAEHARDSSHLASSRHHAMAHQPTVSEFSAESPCGYYPNSFFFAFACTDRIGAVCRADIVVSVHLRAPAQLPYSTRFREHFEGQNGTEKARKSVSAQRGKKNKKSFPTALTWYHTYTHLLARSARQDYSKTKKKQKKLHTFASCQATLVR